MSEIIDCYMLVLVTFMNLPRYEAVLAHFPIWEGRACSVKVTVNVYGDKEFLLRNCKIIYALDTL
jgi:hypothetical protein